MRRTRRVCMFLPSCSSVLVEEAPRAVRSFSPVFTTVFVLHYHRVSLFSPRAVQAWPGIC